MIGDDIEADVAGRKRPVRRAPWSGRGSSVRAKSRVQFDPMWCSIPLLICPVVEWGNALEKGGMYAALFSSPRCCKKRSGRPAAEVDHRRHEGSRAHGQVPVFTEAARR